jgi:predicted RNA-binding protein
MKSLAHPEWPYAGTAHEWRGFVKDEKAGPVSEAVRELYKDVWPIYQKQNFGPELT